MCGHAILVYGDKQALGMISNTFTSILNKQRTANRYPYLLPNIVGAGLALVALLMVLFFLSETVLRKESGAALIDG